MDLDLMFFVYALMSVLFAVSALGDFRRRRRLERAKRRAKARELRAQKLIGRAGGLIDATEETQKLQAEAEAKEKKGVQAMTIVGSANSAEEFARMNVVLRTAQQVHCVSRGIGDHDHDHDTCNEAFNELVLRVRGNRPREQTFTLAEAERVFEAAVADAHDRALARAVES